MIKRSFLLMIMFLSFLSFSSNTWAATFSAGEKVVVSGDGVNYRTGASTSYSSKGTLAQGSVLTIVGGPFSSTSSCKAWYSFSKDSSTYYVCATYLQSTTFTLDDAAYCTTLTTAGFPSSYCPYLSYLHSKYPNWQFVVDQTNTDWNTLVSAQRGSNQISSTNEAYWLNSNPTNDGGDWHYSNDQVNAYYMDPRNYLKESAIFIFESLGHDPSFYNSGMVNAVFSSSSFLRGVDTVTGKTYADIYMDAAIQSSVSPVHLATRTVQEGASNETYETVSGLSNYTYNGVSLNGYYNFYNIRSTGDVPRRNGLAYAANLLYGTTPDNNPFNRPWNTREKAIIGGAKWIGDGYISKGQDTLYYQKFNSSPRYKSASPYSHQYMENVQAPSSEARQTYAAYNENDLLKTAFRFYIPVYSNMPGSTFLPGKENNNSYLSSLMINGNNISGFDCDITTYYYYVPTTTTKISIKATALKTSTTISPASSFDVTLTNSVTKTEVTTTAEDGSTKTYTIYIEKTNDTTSLTAIINRLSVKVNNSYLKNIKGGTDSSTLISSVNRISPSSKITVYDENGSVITNGLLKTNYQVHIASATNENGSYRLAVTGDTNGDGEVGIHDLLRVQKHLLGSINLDGSFYEAGDTNSDNAISILDLLRVQKKILGEIDF